MEPPTFVMSSLLFEEGYKNYEGSRRNGWRFFRSRASLNPKTLNLNH